jgi:hypothetical protein
MIHTNDCLLFLDTFERISHQFHVIEGLLSHVSSVESKFWVIYNGVVLLIPILEKLIFAGYSDQILDFCLQLNHLVGGTLVLCTSRYIPFRLSLFCVIYEAFANTEESVKKMLSCLLQPFVLRFFL